MTLDVADVINLQLQLVERQPVKARGAFEINAIQLSINLLVAVIQILEYLIPCVGIGDFRLSMRRPG